VAVVRGLIYGACVGEARFGARGSCFPPLTMVKEFRSNHDSQDLIMAPLFKSDVKDSLERD
jgi:hypothetical protein